jgi:hypothetical protein
MAHIVQFRMGVAREPEEVAPRPGEGAQIVIFPGVRRERHVEPQHAEPQRRQPLKGPPERDVLELPE